MNPDYDRFPILQAFGFAHLPPHLAAISEPFFALAHKVARDAPDTLFAGAETATALRKLLEAKDAAVRAALDAPKTTEAP